MTVGANIKGLTLIETVISLSLIAILASLAVVSFRAVIQNQRAEALAKDFAQTVRLARNEAVSRSSTVTVCPALNAQQQACNNNNDWSNGWIIFVDENADGAIANAGDRIRVHGALNNGETIQAASNSIRFNNLGLLTNGAGTYTVQATSCSTQKASQITLNASGLFSVTAVDCS